MVSMSASANVQTLCHVQRIAMKPFTLHSTSDQFYRKPLDSFKGLSDTKMRNVAVQKLPIFEK